MANNEKIPVIEIVGQLEGMTSHNELEKAEAYILENIEKYKNNPDYMGVLALRNEAMIFFSKRNNKEAALENADASMELINNAMLDTRKANATISLNAAKVYRLYGQEEKALFLYISSIEHYEKSFDPRDPRLANMYNNIALNISAMGEYKAAMDLYDKAIKIIQDKPESAGELALTHLNVAYLMMHHDEAAYKEEIGERIAKAKELIDSCVQENTYYIYICKKGADCFEALGRMDLKNEMLRRISAIEAAIKRKEK